MLFTRNSSGQTAVLFVLSGVAILGGLALTTDVLGYYWNWGTDSEGC